MFFFFLKKKPNWILNKHRKISGRHKDEILFQHLQNWPDYKVLKNLFQKKSKKNLYFDSLGLPFGQQILKSTPRDYDCTSTTNSFTLKHDNLFKIYCKVTFFSTISLRSWTSSENSIREGLSQNSEFLWFSLNFWRSLWQLLLLDLKKLIETMSSRKFFPITWL